MPSARWKTASIYYKRLFDDKFSEARVNPAEFRRIEDLRRYPFIDKAIERAEHACHMPKGCVSAHHAPSFYR
jgi:phenylacetate-coenzyme A ligase PaaK-like adenylate-forming protein